MILIANRLSRPGLGLALLTIALALGGCISAHKLDQAMSVPVGMNKVQVVNLLGEPPLRDRQDDGTERWIWSRQGQFGHESVTLNMKDDRVASIETAGERLKHLEEMEKLRLMEERLEHRAMSYPVSDPGVEREKEKVAPSSVHSPARPGDFNPTNGAPVVLVENQPPVEYKKSSEEIWREQQEALAEAQRKAGSIEREARELLDKAHAELTKAVGEAKPAETAEEVPPFTAWYMARQFVSEALPGKRRLFPNPRFARDSTGEQRVTGNVWRAWGYVDTVDASNAPTRLQWTMELEFQGGTKWRPKGKPAFGEKK